jgi:DNA-binding MarR family transcriptional regulator
MGDGMATNPSSIFYWNDWENEAGLMLCSPAAQAAWFRMLCAMARATPQGHFKIGNRAGTVDDLARIMGQDRRDVAKWVAELEDNGVFSRTRTGTIFCRRMVREASRIRRLRVAGKQGGDATARKQREKRGSKNAAPALAKTQHRASPLDSGNVVASTSPKTQESPSLTLPLSDESEEREERFKIDFARSGRCAPLGDLVGHIVEQHRPAAAQPHVAAIRRRKFLDRLLAAVQERLPPDLPRWEAEAVIDAARQAGKRAATPPDVVAAVERLEAWRQQGQQHEIAA